MVYHIFRQYHSLCSYSKRTFGEVSDSALMAMISCTKLQPTKYEFFKVSAVYLGYIISKEGIQTKGCKVKAIRNWPVPIMVTELRRSLGFTNYYRCFIKGYAKVACPFYDQISTDNRAHKKRKIQWMNECQDTFDKLKVLCTSAPFLAFADFTKPFKLHTNAALLDQVPSCIRNRWER